MKMNSFCVIIFILLLFRTNHASSACFKSIISFGDSLADTGNSIYVAPSNDPPLSAAPPYGESFFSRPTGRWSDGRLVIDFIAEALGLPFVQPFLGGNNLSGGDFGGGVNFAVAGCTALPDSIFAEEDIVIGWANVSLAAQLNWFEELFLPNFCLTPSDCKKFLENSLVVVGEIGGNDYSYALLEGKSVESAQSLIPKVVKAISSTIKELIRVGATTLMVPGNLPIGCSAAYLSRFIASSNQTDYDPNTGCLNWLNTFSQLHNNQLQLELQSIRLRNPNITIIYADYYNAAMRFYRFPHEYGDYNASKYPYLSSVQVMVILVWADDVAGFTEGALRACCGREGPYNVDVNWLCGTWESSTCEDPSLHVSWDGLHLTEAAYKLIADALFRGSFTSPSLNLFCASSSAGAGGIADDR